MIASICSLAKIPLCGMRIPPKGGIAVARRSMNKAVSGFITDNCPAHRIPVLVCRSGYNFY